MPLPEIIKQPSVERETFGTKVTPEESQRNEQINLWTRRILLTLVILVALILIIVNRQAFVNLFLTIFTPKPKTPTLVEEIPDSTEPLLVGRLAPIWEDLGYLTNLEASASVQYYQAGTYSRDQYQGAQRIIATVKRSPGLRSESFIFVVTPDGRVFFDGGGPDYEALVANLDAFYVWQEIGGQNPIIWMTEIPNDHPQTLMITPNFALYRRRLLEIDGPYLRSGAVAAEGVAANLAANGYQLLTNLTNEHPNLSFWTKPYNPDELMSELDANFDDQERATLGIYVEAGSEVIVVDQTGLAYVYSATFKNKIDDFAPKRDEMLTLVTAYENSLQQWRTAPTQEWPEPFGWEMPFPGLEFTGQEFYFPQTAPTARLPRYGTPMINACSKLINAKVMKNIGRDDLESVGVIDIPQTPLYRLKDNNHPLLHLAYDLQIGQATLPLEELTSANADTYMDLLNYDRRTRERVATGREVIEVPSFEQYVAAWPLLFFQDPWGRWLMTGENSLVYGENCLSTGVVVEESGE